MKNIETFNAIIVEKRGMSEHIPQSRVNSGNRKSLIMNKDNSNGKIAPKHLQKQSDFNTQLQKISSAGSFSGQKSDTIHKLKRFSSREGDGQNMIKQGYLYKQISPKVIKSDDQINVVFIKELNKYQINNDPTSPKSPKMNDTTLFMHELASNGVLLKGPQSPTSHDILTNNQMKNRIPKSVLSYHQHLINSSAVKRANESKVSKQHQNTITYF